MDLRPETSRSFPNKLSNSSCSDPFFWYVRHWWRSSLISCIASRSRMAGNAIKQRLSQHPHLGGPLQMTILRLSLYLFSELSLHGPWTLLSSLWLGLTHPALTRLYPAWVSTRNFITINDRMEKAAGLNLPLCLEIPRSWEILVPWSPNTNDIFEMK